MKGADADATVGSCAPNVAPASGVDGFARAYNGYALIPLLFYSGPAISTVGFGDFPKWKRLWFEASSVEALRPCGLGNAS